MNILLSHRDISVFFVHVHTSQLNLHFFDRHSISTSANHILILLNLCFQETALVFVKEGDFGCLTQLLSPVEFSRLKLLVLLLGWPYCYSCENANNLLQALWNPAVRFIHLFTCIGSFYPMHSMLTM